MGKATLSRAGIFSLGELLQVKTINLGFFEVFIFLYPNCSSKYFTVDQAKQELVLASN